MVTHFKLNQTLSADCYQFKKDQWYPIAGDFLEEVDLDELKVILKEFCEDKDYKDNPKFEDLVIELR